MSETSLYFFELFRRRANLCAEMVKFDESFYWAELASTIGWKYFLGFFADQELEELLQQIGKKIDNELSDNSNINLKKTQSEKKHILHIASTTELAGGHTRVIASWISNCQSIMSDQMHSLIVTNQGAGEIPNWLGDAIKNNEGFIKVLDTSISPMKRALELRNVAEGWADIVILHIDPNDPLPTVAFSKMRRELPVLFFNHADHVFSIGTSVSDLILDFRETGQKISVEHRMPRKGSVLLPIPLIDPIEGRQLNQAERSELRKEARKRLSISEKAFVGLTIGSAYKYKPAMGHDFFECAKGILMSDDRIRIIAVGFNRTDSITSSLGDAADRFDTLGIILNRSILKDCYLAADVYLEGFPVSSLTALLEAGLCYLPIQRMKDARFPILSGDDVSIECHIDPAESDDAYCEGAIRLFALPIDRQFELGNENRVNIMAQHCGSSWVTNWLNPILNAVERKTENEQTSSFRELDWKNDNTDQDSDQMKMLSGLYGRKRGGQYDYILHALSSIDNLPRMIQWQLILNSIARGEPFMSTDRFRVSLMLFVRTLLPDRISHRIMRIIS